jgi:hypothetical protein
MIELVLNEVVSQTALDSRSATTGTAVDETVRT